MNVLHFTLGPVQGFVVQARRTRDLWSGSFLLSYLAGHAMKAIVRAEGRVVFPAVTDDNDELTDKLLRAIMGESHDNPGIGTLPNRFKAKVPDGFDGKACERAVQDEWVRIADVIWEQYVRVVEEFGNDTREIWDRQVRGFWEMAWVIDPDPGDGSDNAWLDRRKNWRTYQPPGEGGDKCSLMNNWQEMSGFVRAREAGLQDKFWEMAHSQVKYLNLREHERLCAIATIKRLFPDVADEAIGWRLKADRWPSTPYMAALPWIEVAHDKAGADEYQEAVRESGAPWWAIGRYNWDLQCVKSAGKLAELDGNFFHKSALENKNATPGLDEDNEREDLLERLRGVIGAVGRPPSSFYALLLMDGDSLGKLLRAMDSGNVSRALASFTDKVASIVREHCGKTVYAGGDDVLALLPLDKALTAATALRESYLKAFDQVFGDRRPVKTSISAGLVYAHYNTSLRAVMRESHRLLEEVAKDGNGRDSIAASVLTGSGRTVEWVSGWTEKTMAGESVTRLVEELGGSFEEEFASRFFYNVRRRFVGLSLEGLDAHRLLVAEYQKSRKRDDAPLAEAASLTEAERRVDRLLRVCRKRKGDAEEEGPDSLDDLSGAMLVRFLATKGKGVQR